jgi:sirohydrochlorin ferrochelatase
MRSATSKPAGRKARSAAQPTVLLVDNGSLRPAATLRLRKIAHALGRKIGLSVAPVSMLHSDKIPAAKLDGRRAEVLQQAVLDRLRAGARSFVIVPLFIGRSRALTEFIPELVREWRQQAPDLRVRVAAPLALRSEKRLMDILAAQVRAKLKARFLRGECARVALVDHGSPLRAVTQVRNRLARELRLRLGRTVAAVAPCSMERRPGPAYAFNEPLLETLLATPPWNRGPVIVAMLFLLPGRHAGPGGDVARMCADARKASPDLRAVQTGLLADDPRLVDILAARFHATR